MAKLQDIIEYLDSNFKTRELENYKEETGITHDANKDIKKIGYATNLTPEVVELANQSNVDLILTHHDAWHFIFGIKEKSDQLLKKYEISHYYNHLPLDDSDFGTNSTLAKELGLVEVKKTCNEDGFMCGVIGEYQEPKSFNEFKDLVESKLGEKVQSWKFNNKDVNKVFILCGAGFMTSHMKEAVEENCDVYLTGEKILYTVEYAKISKMDLVVGSHTFIELFGVKSMAELVLDKFDVEIKWLEEEHIEEIGFNQK
ncbi:Nif3-like dinuclear metal center hexameric protein [Clostridiaceae bacterium M8S5]|nr:Nif3-like dinuclear metal center hexameric protein [Clostridiaceae bacterium M8S5]